MKKAIVLLSGGQDSVTSLYWAKDNFDFVHTISCNYGQKHLREVNAAKKIADMAGVQHEVIELPRCLVSNSPLVSNTKLENYSTYDEMNKIIANRQEVTFVPMRNALFLTLAANRAAYLSIDNIVTGVCEMDNANFDDCRATFLTAAENYINISLGNDHRESATWIKIHAPLINLSKQETVKLAQSFDGAMDAMAYSHTCYAGKYPPCGKCHSCVLRAEGFRLAGVDDPIFSRDTE